MSPITRGAVEENLDEKRQQPLSSAASPPAPQEQQDDDKSQDQTPPTRPRGRPRRAVASSTSPPTTIHRQGDRGSGDDDAAARLPVYVRFADLVAANIVHNWPTLQRLIAEENFPVGIMIGRNTRAWPLDQVMAWLATRPTAKKVVHGRKRQRHEVAEASA